jgi:hypothetical protein
MGLLCYSVLQKLETPVAMLKGSKAHEHTHRNSCASLKPGRRESGEHPTWLLRDWPVHSDFGCPSFTCI